MAMERVARIQAHLEPDRKDVLKPQGWGYRDTAFVLKPDGVCELTGKRYLFSGTRLPHMREFMEKNVFLDANKTSFPKDVKLPGEPIRNEEFIAAIGDQCGRLTFDALDRLHHSHGHTAQELWELRYGELKRSVDAVIYPTCHAHCEGIVKAAVANNVCLIPYGGGTSVSWALIRPENENRMTVSIDMSKMAQILWIDRTNMTARIQAGAVGQDITNNLEKLGLTLGHEPDSVEFSTLGGWISTRASGMKKNIYGNIEDILVSVRIVTPIGTFEKGCTVPRMSSGPDIHHIVLGSEGTMGVITEATLRIRELPAKRIYGSVVFPDFASGVAALAEVQKAGLRPANFRLVDNEQFKFGQALKPEVGALGQLISKVQKAYVTHWLGFDVDTMVAATLMFEGTQEECERQERELYVICAKYKGAKGGEENGLRGYMLTFMIAYLRDIGFDYGCISESFETSVPWDKVLELCTSTKQRVKKACAEAGIAREPFVSCRVTQLYETGACVYFYFAFLMEGLASPTDAFNHVEHEARKCIMEHGGSVSHHHGIGKLRKEFMKETVTDTGLEILRGIKKTIDPKNIFGCGNLID
eukprot:TRINITY_DN14258_c0_g1_i1.p1 TRINITY_DN14258_c0_g1~~TRINITY_DN14258_c0_g1_i1.p1  ORF type:complete len:595 (+),score=151.84 TRINITY_DN14258_c0_g1_i1:29-1786(+)